MQVDVVDARGEGAVESNHLLTRGLAKEGLGDGVHAIEHTEVLWTQVVAVLDVTLGDYQVVLFGLGTNVREGNESLVFIDYQRLISFAGLDYLAEFANLRHSPLLVMSARSIELVLASCFDQPAQASRRKEEAHNGESRLDAYRREYRLYGLAPGLCGRSCANFDYSFH